MAHLLIQVTLKTYESDHDWLSEAVNQCANNTSYSTCTTSSSSPPFKIPVREFGQRHTFFRHFFLPSSMVRAHHWQTTLCARAMLRGPNSLSAAQLLYATHTWIKFTQPRRGFWVCAARCGTHSSRTKPVVANSFWLLQPHRSREFLNNKTLCTKRLSESVLKETSWLVLRPTSPARARHLIDNSDQFHAWLTCSSSNWKTVADIARLTHHRKL